MPAPPELNDRFRTYLKRQRRQRQVAAGVLSACFLVVAGMAVAKVSPSTSAGATKSLANAASAGVSSAFDGVGAFFGDILRPNSGLTPTAPPENWNGSPASQPTVSIAD